MYVRVRVSCVSVDVRMCVSEIALCVCEWLCVYVHMHV